MSGIKGVTTIPQVRNWMPPLAVLMVNGGFASFYTWVFIDIVNTLPPSLRLWASPLVLCGGVMGLIVTELLLLRLMECERAAEDYLILQRGPGRLVNWTVGITLASWRKFKLTIHIEGVFESASFCYSGWFEMLFLPKRAYHRLWLIALLTTSKQERVQDDAPLMSPGIIANQMLNYLYFSKQGLTKW